MTSYLLTTQNVTGDFQARRILRHARRVVNAVIEFCLEFKDKTKLSGTPQMAFSLLGSVWF